MLKKLSHTRGTTTGPEMSANVWAAPATMSNARAIDRDFVSRQQFNALREPQLSASSRTMCRARSTRRLGNPRANKRPSSATVRVPYMPSHVVGGMRPKARPRSAAPSYMRATFAIDSAVGATILDLRKNQNHRKSKRSSQEGKRNNSVVYVLEDVGHDKSGGGSPSESCQRQAFGIRRTLRKGSVDKSLCQSPRPSSAPKRFFGRRYVVSTGHDKAAARGARVGFVRGWMRRPGSINVAPGSHDLDRVPASPYTSGSSGVSCYYPSGHGTPRRISTGVRPSSSKERSDLGSISVVKRSALHQQPFTLHERIYRVDSYDGDRHFGEIERRCRANQHTRGASSKNEGKWMERSGRSSKMVGACGNSGDRQLRLAISPSPWDAFLGGPPTIHIATGSGQKRPSSAPRTPSTNCISTGCGDRARDGTRSKHATSPSRHSEYVGLCGGGVAKIGIHHTQLLRAPAAGDSRAIPPQNKSGVRDSPGAKTEHWALGKKMRPPTTQSNYTPVLKGRCLKVQDTELIVVAQQLELTPRSIPVQQKGIATLLVA